MPAIRKTRKKKLINKTQKKGEINYNSSMKRTKGGPAKIKVNKHIQYPFSYKGKDGTKKFKGHFVLMKNEAKESPNNWCWSDKNIENMNEIVNDYKLVETTTGDGKKNFCCPINNEGLSKIPYRGVCEEPIIYDEPPPGSKSSLCAGGSGNNAIGDPYCCDKNQLYDLSEMKCRTNNLGDKGKQRVTKGIMKVGKLARKQGAIAGAGGACLASLICAIAVPVIMLLAGGMKFYMIKKTFKKNNRLLEDLQQSSNKTMIDLKRIEMNKNNKYTETQVSQARRLLMALGDIRKKFQPVIKEKQAVGVMLLGEEGQVYIPTGRVLQIITENIDGKEIKTARISYTLSPPSLKAAKGKTKKKLGNRIANYTITLNLILDLDLNPPDEIKSIRETAINENRYLTDEEYQEMFSKLDNLVRNKKIRTTKNKKLEMTVPYIYLRRRKKPSAWSILNMIWKGYKKVGGETKMLIEKAKKLINAIDNDANNDNLKIHHPILGTNGRIIKTDEEYKELEKEMLDYIENKEKPKKVTDAIKEVQEKAEEIETVSEVENKPGFENLNETEKKELIKEAVSTTKGSTGSEETNKVVKMSSKINSTKSKEDLLSWYSNRLDEVISSHMKGGGGIFSRHRKRVIPVQTSVQTPVTDMSQVVRKAVAVNKAKKKFTKRLRKRKKRKRTRRRR